MYFNPNQMVATANSGIDSVASVKGKHFAVAAAGSSVEGECMNHFTAAGLNYPDDIQAEYIAFSDAADMLQNGTIDGAWIMSGAPAAAVTQACTAGCKLAEHWRRHHLRPPEGLPRGMPPAPSPPAPIPARTRMYRPPPSRW